MAILKLAEGPVTATIAATEEVEGNFGPQVKFTTDTGDTIYVNLLPASKQLARLNMDVASAVGSTLRFEQVKKNGTTFTNIDKAQDGAQTAQRAPVAAAPRAAAAPVDIPSLAAIYAQCVDQAIAIFGAKCEQAGVSVDATALQAAAATMFIKATR
jgi:hypothetical protein